MKSNDTIKKLFSFNNPVQVLIDFSRMKKNELKSFLKDLDVNMDGIAGDKSLALARITFRDYVRSQGQEISGWDFSADLDILNADFKTYSDRLEHFSNRKYR